jgi:hypothetical protein
VYSRTVQSIDWRKNEPLPQRLWTYNSLASPANFVFDAPEATVTLGANSTQVNQSRPNSNKSDWSGFNFAFGYFLLTNDGAGSCRMPGDAPGRLHLPPKTTSPEADAWGDTQWRSQIKTEEGSFSMKKKCSGWCMRQSCTSVHDSR